MAKYCSTTCSFSLATILLLVAGWLMAGQAVKITEMSVPHVTLEGSSLNLTCMYDLEGEDLYAMKWYKDNLEFYRWSAVRPYRMYFPVPGFMVDAAASTSNTVALLNVSQSATGNYSCQVSVERTFEVADMQKHMTVIPMPISLSAISNAISWLTSIFGPVSLF